jgi:hypothetical protein
MKRAFSVFLAALLLLPGGPAAAQVMAAEGAVRVSVAPAPPVLAPSAVPTLTGLPAPALGPLAAAPSITAAVAAPSAAPALSAASAAPAPAASVPAATAPEAAPAAQATPSAAPAAAVFPAVARVLPAAADGPALSAADGRTVFDGAHTAASDPS